jgi:hypothetical protein
MLPSLPLSTDHRAQRSVRLTARLEQPEPGCVITATGLCDPRLGSDPMRPAMMTNSEVEQHRPAPVKHDDGARLVTDSDREILAFVAAHRLVRASQIQIMLVVTERSARSRLAALETAGLLRHDRVFHSQPGCYRITRVGLATIKNDLPPPTVDRRSYGEDIGVAWISLVRGLPAASSATT